MPAEDPFPLKRHGGKREGAGRPRGSRNARTLAREQMIREAEAAVRATLTEAQIASMSALDVLRHCMRAYVAAGNFSVASEIAARLAPYEHPRLATVIDQAPAEDARAAALRLMAEDGDPETDESKGTTRDGRITKIPPRPVN